MKRYFQPGTSADLKISIITRLHIRSRDFLNERRYLNAFVTFLSCNPVEVTSDLHDKQGFRFVDFRNEVRGNEFGRSLTVCVPRKHFFSFAFFLFFSPLCPESQFDLIASNTIAFEQFFLES